MERQKRKEHLIIIGVMYVVGAVLFGALAYCSQDELGLPSGYWIFYAILGGWLIAGLITGIFMFSGWIKKRGIGVKVLLCVVFPFTFAGICYAGILGGIPYIIYNIVKCKKSASEEAVEA